MKADQREPLVRAQAISFSAYPLMSKVLSTLRRVTLTADRPVKRGSGGMHEDLVVKRTRILLPPGCIRCSFAQGDFGFSLEDVSPRIAVVAEEGPAAKAAIRKGDVIWAIGSQSVVDEPVETARGLLSGLSRVELLVPLSSVANHTSQLL